MNEGDRRANLESTALAMSKKLDEELKLLQEIRDLLREILRDQIKHG